MESGLRDGQEVLRTRDLQLARAESEKVKIEVDTAAKMKRLEAEKSGDARRVMAEKNRIIL